MIKIFQSKIKQHNSQDGITLLLAVLIMSGITLISITVGFFAVQEIRASRASVFTEPAINAAETAGEQGIWSLKRSVSLPPMCTGTSFTVGTQLNGSGATYNSCRRYVGAKINLEPNTPLSVYLYDPNNIEGDKDLSQYPYGKVRITYISGADSIFASAERLGGASLASNILINSGSTVQDISIPATATGVEARTKITLVSTNNAVVEVTAFSDPAGTVEVGLPDYPTIYAEGCQTGAGTTNCSQSGDLTKRSMEILVPQ